MPRNFTDKALWLGGGIKINALNVATLGQASLASPTTIPYGSQDDLGKRVEISNAEIANYTDTSIGTLYGGLYQLVQVHASASAANCVKGRVAFLATSLNVVGTSLPIVTDESKAPAATGGYVAGVFIGTATPGYYAAIQVGGVVNITYADTQSVNTGTMAVGDVVGVGNGDGKIVDLGLIGSTAIPTAKAIGYAVVTAPVSSSANIPIRLQPICYQV